MPTETLAQLQVHITEPATKPETLVVLLHGFGAPGTDLVGLAHELRVASPAVFAMPAAPLTLGGMYGDGRAWWMIDLAALERDLAAGRPRDRRSEVPAGMPEARAKLNATIDLLLARYQPKRFVLGGFSQGAMLSLDAALHREVPPDGLILMSGTLLNMQGWQKRANKLAGKPVMVSHGRRDPLLPFAIAEEMVDLLSQAGAKVDWVPFAGGHEIPMPVLRSAIELIDELAP